MARVTALVLILLLILIAACTQSTSSLPDTPENRATLAKRYLEVMPPKQLLEGVEKRVSPSLPEERRQVFHEVLESPEIQQAAYGIMLDSLVKDFTVAELNAMITFYGSEAGQSAWKKFSPYMDAIMPKIQAEVRKAVAAHKPPEAKEAPKPEAPPAAPAPEKSKAPAGQK